MDQSAKLWASPPAIAVKSIPLGVPSPFEPLQDATAPPFYIARATPYVNRPNI